MVYLISYDLIAKPESAYENLIAVLTKWNAVRVEKSEWVVSATPSAGILYGILSAHIDTTRDRLLVTEITNNLKGINLLNAGDRLDKLLAHAVASRG